MKIPQAVLARLWSCLIKMADRRAPDVEIGGSERPYLRRWWLIPRNPVFNVYLHHFLRSDDDRALHDHPWVNCSILLSGSYLEHVPLGDDPSGPTTVIARCEGDVVFRGASASHRVQLHGFSWGEVPVWTLFITGPRLRNWGFWCPERRWVPWQKFTNAADGGKTVGPGCGEP